MVAEDGVSDKPALIGKLAWAAVKRLLNQNAKRPRLAFEARGKRIEQATITLPRRMVEPGMASAMADTAGAYDKTGRKPIDRLMAEPPPSP